jgi:hypothetical protein
MAKAFEDAFRSLEILKDDSPKYVAESRLQVPPLNPEEKQAKINGFRKEKNAQDADWLEIIIEDYKSIN